METTLSAEEILDLMGAPIPDLLEAYKLERLRPEDVIEAILEKSNTLSENAIWITQPNRTLSNRSSTGWPRIPLRAYRFGAFHLQLKTILMLPVCPLPQGAQGLPTNQQPQLSR